MMAGSSPAYRSAFTQHTSIAAQARSTSSGVVGCLTKYVSPFVSSRSANKSGASFSGRPHDKQTRSSA